MNISTSESGVTVRTIGSLALPNPQTLRAVLNANGLKSTSVQLELDPVKRDDLPGSRTPATDTANAATATEGVAALIGLHSRDADKDVVEKYDRVRRCGSLLASVSAASPTSSPERGSAD